MTLTNVELITDLAVANWKYESLLKEPFVGLNCEGVELGRPEGNLTLVQMIAQDKKVILFDILVCPAICENV